MTVGDKLREIRLRLKEAELDSWSLDAQLIVARAMGFTKLQLVTRDTQEVSESEADSIEAMLLRRLKHEPMQYILGECEFMGLMFEVSSATLIPRADTENLVERAIAEIRQRGYSSLLDLCTGTGAIAVSIAAMTGIKAVASDISEGALRVAERNAGRNNTDVSFIQSDLFDNIKGKFDIITSNPPYIESSVIPTLDSQVKDYEPLTALDGGESGLDFYVKIIDNSQEFLNKGGMLIFEIGYNQGEEVAKLMQNAHFQNVTVSRDLAGLDRVVSGFYL
jgi:release factor glutamine methyltransferase